MTQASAISELKRNWFTISSLVSKDFKLKYRRSVLGVLWSVLNPLLMMCVLAVVFSNVLKFGGDVENFPMYLILGNILFALMADSTSGAMGSILESAPLIKKIRVSKMIFPLEKVLFQLVNFAISLIAVVIVMLVFRIPPTANLLALPILLVFMMLFCAGLGMLLSALAVFFRDVCHLWGVVITAWTYATPLFYPINMLPDWMQSAEAFNPMYHYVTYFRDIAMYNTLPGLKEQLICLGMALATFAVGFAVFKATEKKFILYGGDHARKRQHIPPRPQRESRSGGRHPSHHGRSRTRLHGVQHGERAIEQPQRVRDSPRPARADVQGVPRPR